MVCSPVNKSCVISINDLLDRYYRNESLLEDEYLALMNYERFQLSALVRETGEEGFSRRYRQLQAMANLSPYQEFLKDEYSSSN